MFILKELSTQVYLVTLKSARMPFRSHCLCPSNVSVSSASKWVKLAAAVFSIYNELLSVHLLCPAAVLFFKKSTSLHFLLFKHQNPRLLEFKRH